jgi:hypothetical protein
MGKKLGLSLYRKNKITDWECFRTSNENICEQESRERYTMRICTLCRNIREIKLRRIKWVRHVACTAEMRCAYKSDLESYRLLGKS